MAATPLQVYEAIKPKLGEKEAQLLFEHIARQTEISTKDLATKADIRDMATKADIRDMATKADLAVLRGEMAAMREQMATLATREELAKLEARLIRWNVGTIIAVAGLTLAIVKLIG